MLIQLLPFALQAEKIDLVSFLQSSPFFLIAASGSVCCVAGGTNMSGN